MKHVHIANDIASMDHCGEPTWQIDELAGRLVELSAKGQRATMSLCASLILQAQESGETTVWLGSRDSGFYPPDLQQRGIDLRGLAIVRAPDFTASLRCLERLLRSGALGLIVFDHQGQQCFPLHAQGRLAGLAKRHQTAVVILRDRFATQPGSMGSMVDLHAEGLRHHQEEGRFRCMMKVLKDKRRGPHWTFSEWADAPTGLY